MLQKIVLLVFLVSVAFFVPAAGQNNVVVEKKAIVTEFYRLMNPDSKEINLYNLIDVQAEESGKMLLVMVSSDYQSLDEEHVKALKDLILKNRKEISRRLQERMKANFNIDKYVETVFESFYDGYFTLDEIKSALNFYKSSAGIKARKMNQALNAHVKQKVLGEFTQTLWNIDVLVKAEMKPKLAAEFGELMLKVKNPPVKRP